MSYISIWSLFLVFTTLMPRSFRLSSMESTSPAASLLAGSSAL